MSDKIQWSVVFLCPGEEEMALLAELSARSDTRVVGLLDPEGKSVGAGLAEVLGLAVYPDLESIPSGVADYLIHPLLDGTVAPFVDTSREFGLQPMTAKAFSGRMLSRVLARPEAPKPEANGASREFVERETDSIHRILSRLEEAMDRESLLRWLLQMATRSVRAGSGSIMLYDEAAGELYLAHAHGLSETTMHATRTRIGEGIAGKVARTGKAVMLNGNQQPGSRRDRSELKTAISAPIHWDGRLLGVLNLSTPEGQADLVPNAMEVVGSLTHRFGHILDRFLRMQSVQDNEQFRRLEEEFTQDTGRPENLRSTLVFWAEDLAKLAGADGVVLGLLTADGDLLKADAEEITYQSPPDPRWAEVLTSGHPQVLRPGEGTDSGETVFLLPVGHAPCRAMISLRFTSAARAHHFHTISSDILYLVTRHLDGFLERVNTNDQMDRLTTLSAVLSDMIKSGTCVRADRFDSLLSAACSLTGGKKALLLEGPEHEEPFAAGADTPALLAEANRLLEQAGSRGWSSSIMTMESREARTSIRRSMLVVALDPGRTYPGLVILDKQRLHALDGLSFTDFDAIFARRLAPLLVAEPAPPDSETRDVEIIPPAAVDSVNRMEAPGTRVGGPLKNGGLEAHLSQEMDRCDRYHTRLGLVAFRMSPTTGPAPDTDKALDALYPKLRSSDRVGALADGTIMIVVPEDIQSLGRLQARVTDILQKHTGQPDLVINTSSRVYPGGGNSPQDLISATLQAMP
jgi:hypothetical protein